MKNVKEYLSQAFHIDKQLKSKLEQLSVLRELATTTTQPLSDMPGSPNRNTDRMEKAIIKIMDMEKEISEEVDVLLDLKNQIAQCIKKVEDIDCQLILEFRYLCFMSWEDIAAEMNFTVRNVHILHGKALKMVQVP
jgi:DNA-directed RNA polymerase specialized sigma subunit